MSSLIKYGIILFCFCICFIKNIRTLKIPYVRFVLASLFFTILADYFLIFTDNYPAGLIFFCLVQFCYCKVLNHSLFPLLENGLFFSFSLWMSSIIFKFSIDLTALFAGFYIACLVSNLFYAWREGDAWFASAVTLMLLCDIHVGLANLSSYIPIQSGTPLALWCGLAPQILWIFYIPAQFMVSLTKNEEPLLHRS